MRLQSRHRKDTEMNKAQVVRLYENNAGGLYVIYAGVVYSGFEGIRGASFAEDAPCLVAGETDDWILDTAPETAWDCNGDALIATYDGKVHVTDAPIGVAGRLYLGL